MSTKELFTKGARVWIPDAEEVWRGADLLEDYKGQKTLKIEYENKQGRLTQEEIAVKTPDDLPPLRNPEILIGENDLTSLSYLHEPAVLHNLQVRFVDLNAIYTYCGIVLVAINPYDSLPIYGNETIMAYSGQDMASMDPHIYAVAEEAFKQMTRFDKNQSIIVSGESGAGKTVSAKYAMRYFALVGGNEDETQVEQKVLSSNPIMESIGNAKTIRNDNSSRFGKYIELGFNRNSNIIGANMRTYLLEKSRVVFQAQDERNYHVFYQLCASADLPELAEFKLHDADTFYYTNQGENPYIDEVDDAAEFQNLKEAFTILGINEKQQHEIFRIFSAILHFGNVVIDEGESEDQSVIQKGNPHLAIMANLLGIDENQMKMWLCNKKFTTMNEVLIRPLTMHQALFAKDALSKHIYSKVFDWIVTKLNKALQTSAKYNKFIGVLDIYGFETFEINSFEQFCINYANEKLQQQFCLHVFKLEQEEYVREEIEWSFIDFYDNQPCIDLIESKLGILDLLDEECKMPKGSDANWTQKLYKGCTKSKHFKKPRMSNTAFLIIHFADTVEYQSDGFLEKNRDTVLEEQLNILKASQYELVAELFTDEGGKPRSGSKTSKDKGFAIKGGGASSRASHKKTVGSQFRDSLKLLMETLFSTTPHYVRCIKPNDLKAAFTFDNKRAVQQLRACGVLETIRISAAGYPSRWTYQDFFARYRVLARHKHIDRTDMKKTCVNIVSNLIQDSDKYQLGKTKIFFRAGQVAYLEKLRSDKLRACGIMIQKHVRGWLQKRRYQKIKKTVKLVQTYGRGLLARKQALFLKRTHAVTQIQTQIRRFLCRKRFIQQREAVMKIQALARGVFSRRMFKEMVRENRAVKIQTQIRGLLARRRFKMVRNGIIKLQSHYRRRKAKAQLKILKIEAKSIDHFKKTNKGLENKIIDLQQKLMEKNKVNTQAKEAEAKVQKMKAELSKLHDVEVKSTKSLTKIEELEKLVATLREELDKEKGEKDTLVSEKSTMQNNYEKMLSVSNEEKNRLKDELDASNEKLKLEQQRNEEILKEKMEALQKTTAHETEEDRAHHQRLVKENARLQQRFENLQSEMNMMLHRGHKRTPSDLSTISYESEISERMAELKGDDVSEDYGYGSQQRQGSFRRRRGSVDNVEWQQQQQQQQLQSTPGTAPSPAVSSPGSTP
ncbi:unnamed protein product, partial [Owenia fusiformis]